jgi:phage baseplate assembly protein W
MKPFINRQPDYSDLDLDFFAHPTTKDVQVKTGEDAIKRSVRNLIFSNYYEKPFRSEVGSDVPRQLFENMTPFSELVLQNAILDVLRNFEPRISVVDIRVEADEENNGYNVTLYYIILNRNLPAAISMFLERIR